jgi:phosphoribosylformylglycinamidine (FGAM) synthase PurS component
VIVRGYAVTGLENNALWHERDISHSSAERVILPDACITVDYMLAKAASLLDTLVGQAGTDDEESRCDREDWSSPASSCSNWRRLARRARRPTTGFSATPSARWDEGLDFRELVRQDPDISRTITAGADRSRFRCSYPASRMSTASLRASLPARADDVSSAISGRIFQMFARVYVTLKNGVLDPQGRRSTMPRRQSATQAIEDVRQGKYFELRLDPQLGENEARAEVEKFAHDVLCQSGHRELPG